MPQQLSDKEPEERLKAAGNRLLQPPSSVDELLPLLDEIEELLSKVEQSPAQSMQTALSPLMTALVVEELVKHSDEDVKVGVASCISEITRITAPDAPYDDDKMKDVFQLIVSSFENLSETSSRSFGKRATILETVAKVRSCVIMLDLECDQMIIEMFQYFLDAIRGYHSEAIFASMETIMTLVLEESEDISSDLLRPILVTLKKNKNVLPIAKKLAERVIESSSDKLRPYLAQAVKLLNSGDDYGEVVASLCRENTNTIGNSNESISKELQVAKEGEGTDSQEKDPTFIESSKSVVTNGINETCTEETMADANSSKAADSDHKFGAKLVSKTESDGFGAQNSEKLEANAEVSEAHEAAFNHEIHSEDVPIYTTDAEPATAVEPATEAEPVTEPEPATEVDPATEVEPATKVEPVTEVEPATEALPATEGEPATEAEPTTEAEAVEAAKSLNKVKDAINELSPSHASENEAINVASPAHRVSLSDESRSKKDSPAKGKDNLDEEIVSVNIASKKASAGRSLSKSKKQRRGGKKSSGKTTVKSKESTGEGASKIEGSTSDSEARSLDQTQKLRDANNKMEDGSSRTKEDGKEIGRVKPTSGKDASAKEVDPEDKVTSPRSPLKSSKDEGTEEETPKTVSKRKRTPGIEKACDDSEHGKNLIGSKVRVWWPKDRMFYEGVVESFDSVKKKHKVVYNDGDEEVLNLKRERWELIKDDLVSDGDDDSEHSSHDTLSEVKKKKKGYTDSEASKNKRQKVDNTPKSKVKDSATKSGGKLKDQNKPDSETKDNNSKPSRKAVDEAIKLKDHSQKLGGKSQGKAFGGKNKDESAKASGGKTKDETGKSSGGKTKDETGKSSGGKTKDETGKSSGGKTKDDSAKTPSHPKQDSQKTPKSKGKTPQSGKNVNDGAGSKTTKSSSSKAKETDRKKEKLAVLAKSSESAKGKSVDSAKSRESEAKSGKKRKR